MNRLRGAAIVPEAGAAVAAGRPEWDILLAAWVEFPDEQSD